MWAFHGNFSAKGATFLGHLLSKSPPARKPLPLVRNPRPTLGPWTGFEPVRLENPSDLKSRMVESPSSLSVPLASILQSLSRAKLPPASVYRCVPLASASAQQSPQCSLTLPQTLRRPTKPRHSRVSSHEEDKDLVCGPGI
ncbi:hypothetical protein E2C01_047449 [Portunus trituberculatus]|uniref:Uncharacterized protein n=1 Tax=Portunus trituberculatus TaxID=210409 RepID=A0A5B7GAI6_PORTR|nr:hypothetical protein [Portunus trituberculatus]